VLFVGLGLGLVLFVVFGLVSVRVMVYVRLMVSIV
jgi:hypothetical protein